MTDKNRVQYWMNRKDLVKFAETGPEMQVKKILESLQVKVGFVFKHGTEAFPLTVVCLSDDGLEQFDLHPDFIVQMPNKGATGFASTLKAVEVDGVYHFTDHQEKKRRWRDSLLLKHGYDVVHIDARLTIGRHRPYLRETLLKALQEGSPVELIVA